MPQVVTQLWNEREKIFVCPTSGDKDRKAPLSNYNTTIAEAHKNTNDNQATCQEVIRNTSFLNLELIIAQASRETAGMMNKADPSE